tara:strand:+ start:1124 stop:1534 length:411 start_codon:yes stop_codon:yes gene_type:complete
LIECDLLTNKFIRDQEKATMDPEYVVELIKEVLEDYKFEKIVIINLQGKATIGDFMIVASGNSARQIASLAETLIEKLKKTELPIMKPEGLPQGDWVLIDTGNVIVHLFRPEVREFYNLEKMWEADLDEDTVTTKS